MAEKHKWEFAARFRRGAFGWRSRPAVKRVKEAVSEIKKVARRDPVLATEGAVRFLEKVSPALEHVESSSGAIGSAVNKAIEAGVAALRWLVEGYGYEISNLDVLKAYNETLRAAENAGRRQEVQGRIRALVETETFGERFVTKVLGKELGLG